MKAKRVLAPATVTNNLTTPPVTTRKTKLPPIPVAVEIRVEMALQERSAVADQTIIVSVVADQVVQGVDLQEITSAVRGLTLIKKSAYR